MARVFKSSIKRAEKIMYEMSVSYDNTDGQFRFDELICLTMGMWGGEEIGSGQCLQTNIRNFGFEFEEEEDREAAWGELQNTLGDRFEEVEFSFPPEPKEVESTLLAIKFGSNQPWIPQEIIATLSFDLCSGW